jgi:PAS domain S-box-containing protein
MRRNYLLIISLGSLGLLFSVLVLLLSTASQLTSNIRKDYQATYDDIFTQKDAISRSFAQAFLVLDYYKGGADINVDDLLFYSRAVVAHAKSIRRIDLRAMERIIVDYKPGILDDLSSAIEGSLVAGEQMIESYRALLDATDEAQGKILMDSFIEHLRVYINAAIDYDISLMHAEGAFSRFVYNGLEETTRVLFYFLVGFALTCLLTIGFILLYNLQRARTMMKLQESQSELHNSQKLLAQAESVSRQGAWEWNAVTDILMFSENWRHIHGSSRTQMKSAEFRLFIHPEDVRAFDQVFQAALAGQADYEINYRILREDNREVRYVKTRAEVVFDAGGRAVKMWGATQDVTEQKILEEQLRQAQKMESMGTLAGGIAHDFNNILAVITGFAELALDDAREGRGATDELRQILNAAGRAQELVRQILAFSRKVSFELKPLKLNNVIADTVPVIERTIPKMISIKLDLMQGLWVINSDHRQIEQILLNLAANARDAMEEGGTLRIATANREVVGMESYHMENVAPGNYVVLTFTDTGGGMSAEKIKHIFDPFYTTKDVGKGTGLGLASVYGIVKSHGGYIHCASELGIGTTFTLFFPVITETGQEESVQSDSELPASRARGLVLLVDDEEPLRQIGSRILRLEGFQVIAAASGEEALDLYEAQKCSIDVVVMDLGMPGMGGHKALLEILAINPGAKVVIASGYASDEQVAAALRDGAAGFVAKPYRKSELLGKILSVLAR